jgi:hypothetical protein
VKGEEKKKNLKVWLGAERRKWVGGQNTKYEVKI